MSASTDAASVSASGGSRSRRPAGSSAGLIASSSVMAGERSSQRSASNYLRVEELWQSPPLDRHTRNEYSDEVRGCLYRRRRRAGARGVPLRVVVVRGATSCLPRGPCLARRQPCDAYT